MAKASWQMVKEILDRYEGQTKTVTAMEIVRALDKKTQRASMNSLSESIGVEHWEQ
jgi:hypothetical protein